MIENEKDLSCFQGHKLHVVATIALDPTLSKNQNLCTDCQENTDLDGKVVGLNKLFNQLKKAKKLSKR